MNLNSTEELSVAFGKVVARLRKQRNLTPEALALAVGGLSADEVESMERGSQEASLSEFFRIAGALGEPPGVLFIDVLDEWRADPIQDRLYAARASDFTRLSSRVGWT